MKSRSNHRRPVADQHQVGQTIEGFDVECKTFSVRVDNRATDCDFGSGIRLAHDPHGAPVAAADERLAQYERQEPGLDCANSRKDLEVAMQ